MDRRGFLGNIAQTILIVSLPPRIGFASSDTKGIPTIIQRVVEPTLIPQTQGRPEKPFTKVEDNESRVMTENYFGDPSKDPLYEPAVSVVIHSGQASIALIQRKFRIGYSRAVRLMEEMERMGVVSPMQPKGKRLVMASSLDQVLPRHQ